MGTLIECRKWVGVSTILTFIAICAHQIVIANEIVQVYTIK